MTLEEESLFVMMRLKVGLFQKDLAHRFGMSEVIVSRVFTSEVVPYMSYIGMCGPNGYGFSAVLVTNRVSILADFGINRV